MHPRHADREYRVFTAEFFNGIDPKLILASRSKRSRPSPASLSARARIRLGEIYLEKAVERPITSATVPN